MSKEGTQCAILEEMFIQGGFTLDEMKKACNSTENRVRSLMNSRSKEWGVTFIRDERGRYFMKIKMESEEELPKKTMKGFEL